MRSQISWKTNDKKSTNEIISRHLASNLHIGMSRDLTTALILVLYFISIKFSKLFLDVVTSALLYLL